MKLVIGIKHSSDQLVLETSMSQDDILHELAAAQGGPLVLSDDKGRKVFVPADSLAYVEMGATEQRRVGFGI
ncbi:DUF3107 domain-containing protein [Actinomyces vulturis]|uniref:DUF3107 domain-containing protein n=1 Tax=Actinomyces vulturis TaxID=1857645 RepID=UPI00082C2439|nr:DUF3107 domain-containing protein [Actinomyces vulturis]